MFLQSHNNEEMLSWINSIKMESGRTTDGEYNINEELILKKKCIQAESG